MKIKAKFLYIDFIKLFYSFFLFLDKDALNNFLTFLLEHDIYTFVMDEVKIINDFYY